MQVFARFTAIPSNHPEAALKESIMKESTGLQDSSCRHPIRRQSFKPVHQAAVGNHTCSEWQNEALDYSLSGQYLAQMSRQLVREPDLMQSSSFGVQPPQVHFLWASPAMTGQARPFCPR